MNQLPFNLQNASYSLLGLILTLPFEKIALFIQPCLVVNKDIVVHRRSSSGWFHDKTIVVEERFDAMDKSHTSI